MKLAIVLLALGCLYVGISQQQHFMPRRYPLPYYFNSNYDFPAQLSRNNLMMRQGPLFVVRNNYVQPYSRPNPPLIEDQLPVVIFFFKLLLYI